MRLDELEFADVRGGFRWRLNRVGRSVVAVYHSNGARLREACDAIESLSAESPQGRVTCATHIVDSVRACFLDSHESLTWATSLTRADAWRPQIDSISRRDNQRSTSLLDPPKRASTPTVWDLTDPDATQRQLVADLLPATDRPDEEFVIDRRGRTVDRAAYEGWLDEAKDLEARLATLGEQRDRLRHELQRTSAEETERTKRLRSELQSAQVKLTDTLRQIDRLREQLAKIAADENAVRRELRVGDSGHAQATVVSSEIDRLWQALRQVDLRLSGWRRAQQRLSRAIDQLRQELSQISIDTDGQTEDALRRIRQSLRDFETTAESIIALHEGSIETGAVVGDSSLSEPKSLKKKCGSLYRELHGLYDHLTHQHAALARRSVVLKLRHLRRLNRDLSRHLRSLLERREGLLQALARSGVDPECLSSRSQQGFCSCAQQDGYSRCTALETRSPVDRDLPRERLATEQTPLLNRLRELSDRYRRCQSELEQFQQEAAHRRQRCLEIEDELARVQRQDRSEPDSGPLRQTLTEIEERQSRYGWLLDQISSYENGLRAVRRLSLEACSNWLTRLSRGRWTHVSLDTQRRQIVAQESEGNWQPWEQLEIEDRRLILMGIALGTIATSRSSNAAWPVLVYEPAALSNCQPALVASLVTEAADQGCQVWLLTGDRSFAQQDLLGDAAVALPDWEAVGGPPQATSFEPPRSLQRRVVVHRANNSDAEEFPGEFRDQVIAESPVVNEQSTWTRAETVEAYETGVSDGVFRDEVDPEQWLEEWLSDHREPVNASADGASPWPTRRVQDGEHVPSNLKVGLEKHGVTTWQEFADCEFSDLLVAWDDEGRDPDELQAWHSVAALLCTGAVERLFDARVLAACGIQHPRELRQIHSYDILSRIRTLQHSAAGRAVLASGGDDELARLCSWVMTLEHAQPLQEYGYRDRPDDQPAGDDPSTRSKQSTKKRHRATVRFDARHPVGKQDDSHRRQATDEVEELTFYLELTDDLEAAPSIGPKTAVKFAEIEIVTVEDFLSANPYELAAQLDQSRLDGDRLLTWQQQTELVCRIPNLRGHDAQLLVACDVTTPEELVGWDAEELFERIGPFAQSTKGQRILRAGREPDLNEVSDWIRWAQHTRALRAA